MTFPKHPSKASLRLADATSRTQLHKPPSIPDAASP
eukprot:CAMPEP_0185790070 /NCGR_PEP_ID=MMETSP1174-20130828/154379_1 /TAXON_ID=35687 /ORGANISM="Dictyocha speculum, Strain CCMP1381" /LENGTH=35 /DNA_ID= /DNA_START= /DNA_END= /DNA_ORIENTATION=